MFIYTKHTVCFTYSTKTSSFLLCSFLFLGFLLLANCYLPHQVSQPTYSILQIRKFGAMLIKKRYKIFVCFDLLLNG